MTYAMMPDPESGMQDVFLRRDGRNKIIIHAEKSLTDDQMQDIYWVVLAMVRTGKRLKDLIGRE